MESFSLFLQILEDFQTHLRGTFLDKLYALKMSLKETFLHIYGVRSIYDIVSACMLQTLTFLFIESVFSIFGFFVRSMTLFLDDGRTTTTTSSHRIKVGFIVLAAIFFNIGTTCCIFRTMLQRGGQKEL